MEHTKISIKRQIKIYTEKCFRIFLNEKGWKIFISAAIISVLITSVISDDMFVVYGATRSGSFALICGCIWIGIFNSIQSICKERDIIKREYRAGLSIYAYIMAHLRFEMVLCAVEALIVTITVLLTNYERMEVIGVFLPMGAELYISFFLAILSADALGLMVSSIVKSTNTAMTVMPFVLIIQLIFSGVIFALEGVALSFSNVTVCKWSLNALCSSANLNELELGWLAEHAYPEDYEHTVSNLLLCWGVLVAFVLIYIVLSVVFLKSVDKDKR